MVDQLPSAVEFGSLSHISDCMLRLKHSLEVILTVIPKGSRIALLDEPVHRNIGDHLIHLGIERFFREHDMEIIARAHTFSYRRPWLGRRISRDTVIACNGGGHLGDLYPGHQQLRERVVTDFPGHRVVVLPQSMYFKDNRPMRQAAALFGQHPDFHLFLRDRDSMQQAEAMGLGKLYLAPDMAHALYPIDISNRAAAAQGKVLYLLRRDMEDTAAPEASTIDESPCDWPDLVRHRDTLVLATLAAGFALFQGIGPPQLLNALLDQRRAILVERGIELLARYDEIVTSRLHGALLGLLLGRKVQLLASLTGKSHAYYRTWLTDHPRCEYLPAILDKDAHG